MIVSESNQERQISSDPDHQSTKWHPVTKGEVWAFVGILILMANPKTTTVWDVLGFGWTNSPGEHCKYHEKNKFFFQIWHYFHLA